MELILDLTIPGEPIYKFFDVELKAKSEPQKGIL